jgi:hypothetical protein
VLCVVALAAGLSWRLDLAAFDLVWTHSVEHVEWREHWRVLPDGLKLEGARVEGSGAGMEPGPGAVFDGTGWSWSVDQPPVPRLGLARSGAVPDWSLCDDADCRPLPDWLVGLPPTGAVSLSPCTSR